MGLPCLGQIIQDKKIKTSVGPVFCQFFQDYEYQFDDSDGYEDDNDCEDKDELLMAILMNMMILT